AGKEAPLAASGLPWPRPVREPAASLRDAHRFQRWRPRWSGSSETLVGVLARVGGRELRRHTASVFLAREDAPDRERLKAVRPGYVPPAPAGEHGWSPGASASGRLRADP